MTTAARRAHLIACLTEAAVRKACHFRSYFPDEGPLRRELYPQSVLFFTMGTVHRERMFLAANRTGKTSTAAYEVTAHTTGDYPHWWPGRTFDGPTDWWVAGDTRETTRDIVQRELLGPRDQLRRGVWRGMIPGYVVLDRTLKSGIADAIDMVWIRHVERQHGAPCTSTIQFKSYDQGRAAFQGTSLSGGVWLDEEPPDASETPDGGGLPSGNGDIYTECLLRTATTNGLVLVTLTPLRGLTPFIDGFLTTALMADPTGKMINAKLGMFGEGKR